MKKITLFSLILFLCSNIALASARPRCWQGAVPFSVAITEIQDSDGIQIVDWGDGEKSEICKSTSTYYPTYHTYQQVGEYDITTNTSSYRVFATNDIRGPFVTNKLEIVDLDDIEHQEVYLKMNKIYYFKSTHDTKFPFMFYKERGSSQPLKKYVVFQTWAADKDTMRKGASIMVSIIVSNAPNTPMKEFGRSGKAVKGNSTTGTFGYIAIRSSDISETFSSITSYMLGISITFSKGVTGFRFYTVDSLSEIQSDPYEVRGKHTVQNKYLEFKKLGEDLEVDFKTDGYRDYVDVYLALVDADNNITFYKYDENGDITAYRSIVAFKQNILSATNGIKEIILRAPSYCFPKGTSYLVYLAVPTGTDITSSPLTDYTLEVLEINN